ncbi:MAG: CoA pyrophosphatase [Synergistaceae bacterium]|nr:CoA pyrophosphatase [Synergistota bacterium]NLM70814.1 CoA pyrophosphatase [Synergistaceae bacterium]
MTAGGPGIIDRLARDGVFHPWSDIPPGDVFQSAVLVPLFPVADQLFTLLLRRSSSLSRHGGEICFPGGMKEPCDISPLHTALREAQEEAGIPPEGVEPLSYLPAEYTVVTGVEIIPVLGLVSGIHPERDLLLAEGEITGAYAVKILDFPLHPRRRTVPLPPHSEFGEARGLKNVTFPEYDLPDGAVVWGVTARILERARQMIQ